MDTREAEPLANGGGRRAGGGAEALRGAHGPERSAVRSAPRRSRSARTAIMSDRKAVIKNADMSEEMQQDSVECATQALEKYNIEKDIAAHIKKEFDKKYNPTWHCIVGRNFGSYVTHETKHFIYFYLGQVAILLFKSG
ncbi:dynein light chain 1, cytoplasmic isoform X2 [Poecile atricapillus]|uniref:dynein light chain 1, cytoplasmic isoform X2 n=1 Tax=Poecile atricapillus TaxID=48891 RepID=UPI002738E48A|nr:dynein light chain 1, cytoplasmic isoform X2 [Poecile atricapillus]